MARLTVLTALASLACAASNTSTMPGAAPTPARNARSITGDTVPGELIPAGFGTLRQDQIALRLELQGVVVQLVPLDESVIRLLSPDSYRALSQLSESRRDEIARLATLRGLRERNVWYVTFFGLTPDASFTPTDLTITSAGREFRPVEIIPLRAGFGAQRLQPREAQPALYLFDDGLDVWQPLTVTSGAQRSTRWSETLRTLERERTLVRSRASR